MAGPAAGRRALALAVVLFAVTVVAALAFGSDPFGLVRAILEPGPDRNVAFAVRLPRVVLAAVAGAGLSAAGAAYQALLRNPLAEPFVLGVSGGAALGAALAIVLGVGAAALGVLVVPVFAFGGGLAATFLVLGVARGAAAGGVNTSVLLAGVMVNAIASALITFLRTLVPPVQGLKLMRWLTGFLEPPPPPSAIAAIAVYVAAGCGALLLDAGRLNLLGLGRDDATSLGVDVARLERRTFLACSCIVGAIVSLTGLIAFVGLLVPQAVRRVVGPDQRLVLPLSIVGGATMLVACDLLARLAFRLFDNEPPVGAVTALLGGTLFLLLLRRSPRLG